MKALVMPSRGRFPPGAPGASPSSALPLALIVIAGAFLPACDWRASKNAGELNWRVQPLPEWEEAFRGADPRWRGGDACYTVPLAEDRTLWLFGDTWIAAPQAEGRKGARMIHNSLAVQKLDGGKPAAIDFFWREENGEPAPAFAPREGPGWFWPLSGRLNGERLLIFGVQVVQSTGGLGFAITGSRLLEISGVEKPPAAWRVIEHAIPYYRNAEDGAVNFGASCLDWKGDLYIFGAREGVERTFGGRELILAKAPAASGLDFESWRFFSSQGFIDGYEEAAALFDGAAAEMSISFLEARRRFLAVYTRGGMSRQIQGRLADRPEGPWSEPITFYLCPEEAWSDRYYNYAAKAHPELDSREGRLIVTYAVNSSDFWDHFRDPERLYWPRFIELAYD